MPHLTACKFPGSFEVRDEISHDIVGYIHLSDDATGPDIFSVEAPDNFSRLTANVGNIDILRARLDMIQVGYRDLMKDLMTKGENHER